MTATTHKGSCHCGVVQFQCHSTLEATSRCNCSICRKGRFWKALVPAEEFSLLQGENALGDYTFGSGQIHHLFCRHCGIKPFGRVDLPEGRFYAINITCLDNLDEATLASLPVEFENGREDNWQSPPAHSHYL